MRAVFLSNHLEVYILVPWSGDLFGLAVALIARNMPVDG